MDSGFPSNVPGVNGLGDERNNSSKWYTRWYVWVLPALVLFGVIVAALTN